MTMHLERFFAGLMTLLMLSIPLIPLVAAFTVVGPQLVLAVLGVLLAVCILSYIIGSTLEVLTRG